jgi:peptidyl-tRNA hydrolase
MLTSPSMDPIVQYLIINREILALGHGVLAVQAAHAGVAGYLVAADSDAARAWAGGTFTKIVLAVQDEAALRALSAQLVAAGIAHKLLEESRLQGKASAIGVAPLPKSAVSPLLGRLSPLK